jgi:chromosome segregation ATPase
MVTKRLAVESDGDMQNNVLSPRIHRNASPYSPRIFTDTRHASGEDSNPIQDFVRVHMMSILHPFAEHVRELQMQMGQLSEKASNTSVEVDQHKTKLHHHEAQLSATFSNIRESKEQAQAICSDLAGTQRELSELQTAHNKTKASLGKTETEIQMQTSMLQTLKKDCQDTSSKVDDLLSSSADLTTRLGENVEKRLDCMHDFCKDVQDRQVDMQKALEHSKRDSETLARRLDMIMQSCSQKREADVANFEALAKDLDGLEAKLTDASGNIEEHTNKFGSMSAKIENLRQSIMELVRPDQLQVPLDELRHSLDELEVRAHKSEESIADIIFDSTSERRSLENSIRKVDQKVEKAASDVLHLEENKELVSNSLHSMGQRSANLESKQLKFREHVDAIEQEMSCFTAWQKETAETLVDHASRLDQGRSGIQQAHNLLDINNTSISSLKRDVGAAHEALSTLTVRLDICYKYFQGLGKGLQDTHRHVLAGEGGMLPPKSDFGMALPVLPRTPRTVPPASPRRRGPLVES